MCGWTRAGIWSAIGMPTALRRSSRIYWGTRFSMGKGSPVTLTARDEDDAVTLAVHNGGAPISAEALPFMFEPLARGTTDNARS